MKKKKSSKGKYIRTDKQKNAIIQSNMRRRGSKFKSQYENSSIFGSKIYGRLIIDLLESNETKRDNKDIEHLINIKTWAKRGKREFLKEGLIRYKVKHGGRGCKFNFARKTLASILYSKYKAYILKRVLPKIQGKIERLIREHARTTIEKKALFKDKGKRKQKQSKKSGIFGYVIETISEGNEHERIQHYLTELKHKNTKIFLGELNCSEEEEESIAYHIQRLKELSKQFEGISLKSDIIKEAGRLERRYAEVLEDIENDIFETKTAPKEKTFKSLFKEALSFTRVFYQDYSIYDIFEEMLFLSALKFRSNEESGKDYLIAWLYQSLVLSDFTG